MAAQVVAWRCRLLLALVFLYAGVVKIWDFQAGGSATQDFFQAIMNYQLTSWDVSMGIALFLPWLEVVTAVALFIPRLRLGALLLTGGMMLVFMVALASAWYRGLDISCGCFGREENNQTDFGLLLIRDLLLLEAVAFALWIEWSRVAGQTKGGSAGSPQPA